MRQQENERKIKKVWRGKITALGCTKGEGLMSDYVIWLLALLIAQVALVGWEIVTTLKAICVIERKIYQVLIGEEEKRRG
jgi:hypothetical protein